MLDDVFKRSLASVNRNVLHVSGGGSHCAGGVGGEEIDALLTFVSPTEVQVRSKLRVHFQGCGQNMGCQGKSVSMPGMDIY